MPKDLNFKVNEDFHKAFKVEAAERGWTSKRLLVEMFAVWMSLKHLPATVNAAVAARKDHGQPSESHSFRRPFGQE